MHSTTTKNILILCCSDKEFNDYKPKKNEYVIKLTQFSLLHGRRFDNCFLVGDLFSDGSYFNHFNTANDCSKILMEISAFKRAFKNCYEFNTKL